MRTMQAWSRQSECIFCLLRREGRRQSARETLRKYHTTPGLAQERSRTRSTNRQETPKRDSRQRTGDKWSIKPKGGAKRFQDQFSGVRFRRPLQRKIDGEQEESIKHVVIRALDDVHKYYTSNTMSKDSDVSQMQGLDPEGVLWPEFDKMVRSAMDGNQTSDKWLDLRGKLRAASGQSRSEDINRELRFAFLDHVLDQRGTDLSTGTFAIDVKYPTEWYPAARLLQRTIHLHVGPTNSGKTYNALKRLEQAQSGFYAGPLRLLAHEVYSRFNDRGIRCDLITGDDVRLDDSGEVKLYASTVEMVDSGREADVGVIDEIQMIGSDDRGWAWTRALLATRVKELHLCGEARSVPLIRELVASMGDTLHIHQYERLNPLKVMSRSLKGKLQNLRKGDCVVSFSVVNIHALKKQIELETGRRCAIVYGSLPPDTRAQQAALFNDPDNDYDYLVASDAIGMGLNLSVKRIVFETTKKWNGSFMETLTIPQLKQIAGRAGRYRTSQDDKTSKADSEKSGDTNSKATTKARSIGLVTCLDEADLPILQHALSNEGPPIKAAGILPPGEIFVEFSKTLPANTPFEYIMRRICSTVNTHRRFQVCSIRDQLKVARAFEGVEGLSIASKLLLCAAPASWRNRDSTASSSFVVISALARIIASERTTTVADISEIPLEVLDEPMTAEKGYLSTLEVLHKSIILFLWLSYRFPRYLSDQDMAFRAKELCEERINATLLRFSANPRLVRRLKEMQKSSEMLIQQAKEGALRADTGLMMNPDRTVEEIDADQAGEEPEAADETHLEEKVEFEGELDLGDGSEIQEIEKNSDKENDLNHIENSEFDAQTAGNSHRAGSAVIESEVAQLDANADEVQRAQNSG